MCSRHFITGNFALSKCHCKSPPVLGESAHFFLSSSEWRDIFWLSLLTRREGRRAAYFWAQGFYSHHVLQQLKGILASQFLPVKKHCFGRLTAGLKKIKNRLTQTMFCHCSPRDERWLQQNLKTLDRLKNWEWLQFNFQLQMPPPVSPGEPCPCAPSGNTSPASRETSAGYIVAYQGGG